MHCPSCQYENGPDNQFCGQCGTRLPPLCGSCGFENPDNARFCGGCGASLGDAASTPVPTAEPARAETTAERRHLTVMFCDLVGSTDLSVKFDPEDLSEIIKSYQHCCEQIIRKHDGYVARYMGDGLLNYFGYPTAGEHDTERAIRAGLEIIEAVSKLDSRHGIRMQTRVGIASGNVVVGDVVGEGSSSREETVMGETPNLAARLQSLAPPDGLVVSSRSKQLVGGLFEYQDLGKHSLKGFGVPMHAYTVKCESQVESRFEATRDEDISTDLIGRAEEFSSLQQSWSRAKQGWGQIVMISGEAGIGKSRLLENFRSTVDSENVEVMRMFGSPHAVSTPMHPIIELLKRKAGIHLSTEPPEQFTRLQAFAAERQIADADLPLIASMLGLPPSVGFESPIMPPPEQKFRTMAILSDMISVSASVKPLIVIIEDLHWLDSSSLEFLDQLAYKMPAFPVLVIVTYRTDFIPKWQDDAHSTSILIGRLTESAARDVMLQVSKDKALPEEIITHVLGKADGVPLYVEELTKAILESPFLIEGEHSYTLKGAFQPEVIPETLQDSLMARLDKIAPVKEVAQIGAVLGREFQLSVLQAVTTQPAAVVENALLQLIHADIITCRGSGTQISYLFKHALLQETAYNALLKSRRRQLHALVANRLQEDFPNHVEERPELLAHHFTGAELHDEGFDCWYAASQQSLRKFAHQEVCTNLRRGLALAPKLKDSTSRRHTEFEMRAMLGSALMITKGPGNDEVGDAYREAVAFTKRHQDLENILPVEFGLCRYHWASGELDKAVEMARFMLMGVDAKKAPGPFMAVHVMLGISLWHQGKNEQALANLEKVQQCYRAERDAGLFFTYMMDFGVFGGFYRSLALQSLGRSEEAAKASRASLDLAQELKNPHEIGFALLAGFIGSHLRGENEKVLEITTQCMEFSKTHGFPEFIALAQVCQGSARIILGDTEGSLEQMEEGIQGWKKTQFKAWLPWLHGLLAEACITIGDYSRARVELANAQVLMEHQNEYQADKLLTRLETRLTEATSSA
jgi:class 3 adenylate cyclase/tetratricopeptide (TPR) repeat protein